MLLLTKATHPLARQLQTAERSQMKPKRHYRNNNGLLLKKIFEFFPANPTFKVEKLEL